MSKHIISLEFFFLEFYRSYRSIVDKTLVLTFFLLAGYFVHAQESIITNNKVKLEKYVRRPDLFIRVLDVLLKLWRIYVKVS